MITEHPPVITLGARQSANKLQVSRDSLIKQQIDVVDIRRGGGTTAHNPGQLVFYPILNLQELGLGISEYIRKLETIGTELLEELGVKSQQRKGLRGLWIDNRKICAIGIKVSRWITMHGFALNINTNLSLFDGIIPCGISDKEVTSLQKELKYLLNINDVNNIFKSNFATVFQYDKINEFQKSYLNELSF